MTDEEIMQGLKTAYVHKWLTKHLKAYFTKRGFTCKRHGDRVIVSWRKARKEKIQRGYGNVDTVLREQFQ